MKQKLLKLLMLIALLLTSNTTYAYDFSAVNDDGVTIYYNITDIYNKTVEATGDHNQDYYIGVLNIPSTVKYKNTTYTVTSICDYAFSDCIGLTSVTIPSSVTSIGSSAFYSCTALTSISIPSSVTNIGYWAFVHTGWYKNQPDGILYLNNCCLGYKGKQPTGNLTLNTGTRLIANSAFNRCYSLTKVIIPNSVTHIGESAFNYCDNLATVTIGNSVTDIGSNAFYSCSALTSISIPSSVTSIGSFAFYHTGWYKNQPDGILYLNNCCLGYKGIEPTGNLTLNTGTRLIADNAFDTCYYLTSITIPKSVEHIGKSPFSSHDVISIAVESGNINYNSKNNCNAIIETATNTLITGCKNTIIPNSVVKIADQAFSFCGGLTSITIPKSVKKIGKGAFRFCDGLTTIAIPNSITCIDEEVFYNCTNLRSVSIPNSVVSINTSAFASCYSLTSIKIPDSVSLLGFHIFDGCYRLKSVTLSKSITSIPGWMFAYCDELTSIIVPDRVTVIEEMAFGGCRGLTSVSIPNSVTSIEDNAFSDCI